MSTARRGALAPWPLALTLVLAGCGGAGESVRSCSTDADCGPGALCIQSACVSSRPPLVTLQVPPTPTTNRVVFLDAVATDPDAGDVIARHTWTVTPVSATCEAEVVPGEGPRLELVFWCPGTYEVTVAAEDGRGLKSAPATATVEVAAATGAPVVTTGAAITLDHVCGGTPAACRPAAGGLPTSLPLSAVVDNPGGGALSVRWSMVPPAGVDPKVTVTYAQGDSSLSTEAWVETPGGLIAGTWRFRLRVTTAEGLLGRGEQLVAIGNRPPALAGSTLFLDHRYEAGAYLAAGSLPVAATDPDGDPVTLSFSLEELATDGCTSHLGTVVASLVPYDTSCSDPVRLIGLGSRTIHAVATDSHGSATEALFPVEIGNRAPAVRLASNPAGGLLSVDHSVGACPGTAGTCFLAGGTAGFDAIDPDGDPVTGPAVTAAVRADLTSSRGEATTGGGLTTFRFATDVRLPSEFRWADGTTGFSLVAAAADPFGRAGTLEIPVMIGDRPPVVTRLSPAVSVPHRYDSVVGTYLASATLSGFSDPDGDPLYMSLNTGDAICKGFSLTGGDGRVDCGLPYTIAPGLPPLAAFVGDHSVKFQVSDGWEIVATTTVVTIENGTPTATPFDGAVEYCDCICPKWSPDGSTCLGPGHWEAASSYVFVPVQAKDVDGDPVQVTYAPAPDFGQKATVLPQGAGAAYFMPVLPLSVTATIDDGISRVQTTSRVTSVYCSTTGQACTP